eukprot:gnl/TRDRNA2_/TRDRNA2_169847_c4_seq1.p1 gnl/TRDRNA2_/TRDRNA2_169847_c4~~gnl/TRDRNA2_/TRDRNA2_169847_c4_seq1.p1  ORF type:complete len:650 (+),score=113.77 gnl/TRDRNA2_/TRDRNA2_169847_c4_seq1:99-2048(+)
MADAGAIKPDRVWVWCPVKGTGEKTSFRHPSELPTGGASASLQFEQGRKGPRAARLSRATLLQKKGNIVMVAELGVTREIPSGLVLPWYEGLLVLNTLTETKGHSDYIPADWVTDELTQVLKEECDKYRLSGAVYVEKRLLSSAVTGRSFVDCDGREWVYRRDNVDVNKKIPPGPGVGKHTDEFFAAQQVAAYLPPWEAFCHKKCGFYQDFYKVVWESPFSHVDYSAVENGCTTIGSTWEPDECLPALLDSYRVEAKRKWISTCREREQARLKEMAKAEEQRSQKVVVQELPPKKRSFPQDVAVKEPRSQSASPPEGVKQSVAKKSRRRDGEPLDPDLVMLDQGHDWVQMSRESFKDIASGWPKCKQDYPAGYAAANPPGYCMQDCNCMNDMRPQLAWEVTKKWLEDPSRGESALAALEAFSLDLDKKVVRRRGQVTRHCFFETPTSALPEANAAEVRSLKQLSNLIARGLQEAMKQIPKQYLTASPGDEPVRVPFSAFLPPEADYEPLLFSATPLDGRSLPSSFHLDPASGHLTAGSSIGELQVRIDLGHPGTISGTGVCGLTCKGGNTVPWESMIMPVLQFFNDSRKCQLHAGLREILAEHFAEVYDFKAFRVRNLALGEWIRVMSRILRMVRTAANTCSAPVWRKR